MGAIADIRSPRDGDVPTVSVLVTDWGSGRVPDAIAALFDQVGSSGSPIAYFDNKTPLGRALVAWERRQVERCNEAGRLVDFESDLTTYLKAERS